LLLLPEKDDEGRQVFIIRPGDCYNYTLLSTDNVVTVLHWLHMSIVLVIGKFVGLLQGIDAGQFYVIDYGRPVE